MKFLLDVNVGTTIAKAIVGEGHDVARVSLMAPRADDREILARAVREERILVSYDSDFTDLIYRDGEKPPLAVIYIRFQPFDVADLIPAIVSLIGADALQGHMIVVGPGDTRWRPFPGREDNG